MPETLRHDVTKSPAQIYLHFHTTYHGLLHPSIALVCIFIYSSPVWNGVCGTGFAAAWHPAAAFPPQHAPGRHPAAVILYGWGIIMIRRFYQLKGKAAHAFHFSIAGTALRTLLSKFSYDSLFNLSAVLSVHLSSWLQTSISPRSSLPLLSKRHFFRMHRMYCIPKDTPLCRLAFQNITILLWTYQGACSACKLSHFGQIIRLPVASLPKSIWCDSVNRYSLADRNGLCSLIPDVSLNNCIHALCHSFHNLGYKYRLLLRTA